MQKEWNETKISKFKNFYFDIPWLLHRFHFIDKTLFICDSDSWYWFQGGNLESVIWYSLFNYRNCLFICKSLLYRKKYVCFLCYFCPTSDLGVLCSKLIDGWHRVQLLIALVDIVVQSLLWFSLKLA